MAGKVMHFHEYFFVKKGVFMWNEPKRSDSIKRDFQGV